MLHRTAARLLTAVLAIGFLVIGGWPFAFRPVNHAEWLTGRPGLSFRPDGIAYDPEPLRSDGAAFTVELWLAAEHEFDSSSPSILTVHDSSLPSSFVLCQWKAAIILRIPAPRSKRGFRERGVDGSLTRREARFLTVTGDASGTAFYIDGGLAERFPEFVVPPGSLGGRVTLGDSAAGAQSWSGRIFGCAMLDRALGPEEVAQHYAIWTTGRAAELDAEAGLRALYLFDEGAGQWAADRSPDRHRIWIPPTYRVLHKVFLAGPTKGERLHLSGLADILLNLLGFVPLGFSAFHVGGRSRGLRGAAWAVLIGLAVSLTIEAMQVWLPGRSSSIIDLGCNAAGTAIGALLALAGRRLSANRGAA